MFPAQQNCYKSSSTHFLQLDTYTLVPLSLTMYILDTRSKYLKELNQLSKYTRTYTGAEGTDNMLAREVDFL